MNICEQCDRNHHRRCSGCDCPICPILKRSSTPKSPSVPREKKPSIPKKPVPLRTSTRWNGPTGRPRGRPAKNPLSKHMTHAIAEALVAGESNYDIARRTGHTDNQVRGIKRNLQKLASASRPL